MVKVVVVVVVMVEVVMVVVVVVAEVVVVVCSSLTAGLRMHSAGGVRRAQCRLWSHLPPHSHAPWYSLVFFP